MKLFLHLGMTLSLVLSTVQVVAGEKGPGVAAIASTNKYATESAIDVIKKGGNAFDAAVAITATLAVTEPYGSSLGGGGLWLIYRASDGKQVMIDGRETAPELAHNNLYLDPAGNVKRGASVNGPLAAGIPGIPAGMAHLATNYGKLSLMDTLAPAIRFAENGIQVDEKYHVFAKTRRHVLSSYPDTARIFLVDDEVPRKGFRLRQKDLAETMSLLAWKGASGFYRGKLAQQMVHEVNEYGGVWTLDDLERYEVIEREPVVTNYRDMKIISASPPSSGGVVLGQTLKILSNFDLHSMGNIARKHHVIEAMRRAYRDRSVYLGDPAFVNIPVQRLLDNDYLSGLALGLDQHKATPSILIGDTAVIAQAGSQTTHFSVIDRDGNRVAGTLSINTVFGSGFVPEGTGVLLNANMDDFTINAFTGGHYANKDTVNAIEAGKRPLSSMTPTFLEMDNKVAIMGTPGGTGITAMVLLAALDFYDGKPPESWVSLPRYYHLYLPDVVVFERDGLSFEEQRLLHDIGHRLEEHRSSLGDMQAVMWDRANGRVYAASDPRGNGSAVVFSDNN